MIRKTRQIMAVHSNKNVLLSFDEFFSKCLQIMWKNCEIRQNYHCARTGRKVKSQNGRRDAQFDICNNICRISAKKILKNSSKNFFT